MTIRDDGRSRTSQPVYIIYRSVRPDEVTIIAVNATDNRERTYRMSLPCPRDNFSVAICHLAVTRFLYFRLPIKNPPKRVFMLIKFMLPSFGIALHRDGRLLSIPDNGHVRAYHTHLRISDRHQRKRGKVLWQTHFLRS